VAALLAVASWGFYFLPISTKYDAPFGTIGPWIRVIASKCRSQHHDARSDHPDFSLSLTALA